MAEELPVLVASLSEEKAREIEEASRLGRSVSVPLKWEPAEVGPHILEVYVPTASEPLRLLAEPLGVVGEDGTVLTVYPYEEVAAETAAPLPDVSHDQLVGRSIAGGRFEIVSMLGEGSIGAVYRARHTGLGIVVAVKVLHGAFQRDMEFCRRFYAEALALSRLDHANLVHIYDFGQESDGLLYLSMALVDGVTLRSIQRRERTLEIGRIVSLMLQVSAGLGHAHARGLLHRDVKPDNVMVVTKENDDGERVETVKVLDFGFAVPPSVSGEVAQRLAGTPVYMSPEQCLGEELDARSDVYACGIMMYELATGTVPFLARDSETIRRMQVNVPAPLVSETLPDADPRFVRLVQKALSKRREDRHENMKDLRAELKALLVPEDAPSSVRAVAVLDRGSMPTLPPVQGPVTAPPPSPREGSAPVADWLESRAEGYARFMSGGSSPPPAPSVVEQLSNDPRSMLGALARERDPRAFRRRVAELEGAVRTLAQRADARSLQMVRAVIAGLHDRPENDEASRAALASVERSFADPELLAPIAARLLVQEDDSRDAATQLIADARVAGAYALYGARTKTVGDARARIAFVTTMKSLGESALPVVRAALERVREQALSGQHRAAAELAEDLLLATPRWDDEAAGRLVVEYAASGIPTLCRAAARALPRVWGERARSVLAHLVQHDDDGVTLAAIVGLREIDGVDLDVVMRIGRLVEAGRVRTEALHAAIIAALHAAPASAHAEAAAVLARLGR